MAHPARNTIGREFRKSVKGEAAQARKREAEELDQRQQETLKRISNWFAGIAQSVEKDVDNLPRRETAQATYETDEYLTPANRAAVEKTPGFRALQKKCQEMDVDFYVQARSYTDIDMTDSKYTHHDLYVAITPAHPCRTSGSHFEPYDPPTGYGRLGP